MPINKLPIVYKFGIISPSHRLELQERVARKTQLLSAKNDRLIKPSRNPLEITDDFVQAYNGAVNPYKREKLHDKATKLLEKLKRQAGLKTGGIGDHVNLQIAWTELIQLSQCKGHIQQECFDILLVSLDQSPASEEHIAVLFYLAEFVLYWLRTYVIYELNLGSSEVKLMLMGQRIFTRLFFHYMCGQMSEFSELKQSLHTYLDGFLESQKIYKSFPHILYSIRYMLAVGNIIIGDVVNKQTEDPLKQTVNKIRVKAQEQNEPSRRLSAAGSSRSGEFSSSVHELAPTLWHSLDVWRCTRQLGGGLQSALRTILECSTDLSLENWVDVVSALDVLGDASQHSRDALTTLQQMACGIVHHRDTQRDDAAEGSDTSSTAQRPLHLPAIIESVTTNEDKDVDRDEIFKDESDECIRCQLETDFASQSTNFSSIWYKDIEGLSDTMVMRKGSDEGVFPESELSSLLSNPLDSETASGGLSGWRWELALKYIDILSHIALYGSTSVIRKQALFGPNYNTDHIHWTASIVRSPLASAGLFDMVFFQMAGSETENKDTVQGAGDWVWRVRHAAFLSLSKVLSCLSKDDANLGLTAVIWKVLKKAQQMERDLRVLEALKVAEIDVNLGSLLNAHLSETPSNLGAKIAKGMSAVYLPMLPPISGRSQRQDTALRSKSNSARQPGIDTQRNSRPLRTSLRDEIMTARLLYQPPISYRRRTEKQLQHVILNQWQKQLVQEKKTEQEAKQKELEEYERTREKNLKHQLLPS